MRRATLVLAALALLFGGVGRAKAVLITFEDAVPEDGFFVPQGYKGFQWTGGFGTTSWVLATPSNGADVFSAHSGTNYAFNNVGTSLTMSGGLFDFDSMWAYYGQGRSGVETAHGFLNGVEIYTQQFNVGPTYAQVSLNFTGIDTITFDNTFPYNLVIDDITVNEPTNVTPEPSSLVLLGAAGITSLGYFGWRRRKPAVA